MKRLLSLLVAFAMILSMVPNAFAVEAGEDQLPSDMEIIGSLDNPEVLADLGYYSVTLASGDVDGYYYAYTAVADGTVTANVEAVTPVVSDDNETEIVAASTEEEEVTAAVTVINTVTEASGAEVAVSAGDLVLIQVTASAAATVEWFSNFVYPAGTEQNPILLMAGENTLTIPAGATVYCQGRFGGMVMSAVGEGVSLEHNGTTYALTAEAVEFACVQASFWDPCSFVLTNAGEADATCTLTVTYPLGSMENPEVTYLDWNDVSLEEGDTDGYYYTYEAEAGGKLTMYFASVPEGVEADIVLTNMNTYAQRTLLADGVDNYGLEVTMEVSAGDVIQIQIVVLPDANWETPAAELSWVGQFEANPGTEANPLFVDFEWNENNSEGTATVTVPANSTVYFAAYNLTVGVVLTANGEPVEVSFGWGRMPSTWALTNDTDTDMEYALHAAYPVGSAASPDALVLGENIAVIAGGAEVEYYYTWTAEADGLLTITVAGENGWFYNVNNLSSSVYSDRHWHDDDPVVATDSVAVSAGDEIQVVVGTYNPEDPNNAPAGEVTVTAAFVDADGSENNPYRLAFGWNMLTIPAGETVYYKGGYYDLVITASGDEGLTVVHGGNTYELNYDSVVFDWVEPGLFAITNAGEEELYCELDINYPLGSYDNPEITYLDWTDTALAANDYDGYYYIYNAESDGTLTVCLNAATEDVAVDIMLMNLTTYESVTLLENGVDNYGLEVSMEVSAYDQILIQVKALENEETWEVPAAEVSWMGQFDAKPGTETNPVVPEFTWNKAVTEATATVTVPANTTYYFASYDIVTGMLMTANGEAVEITYGNRWMRMPSTWVITNETDADVAYDLLVYIPLGNFANPAPLAEGENVATIAGGEGTEYYYTWTAEADGTLSIAMLTETGWSYTVNNTTSGIYGEMHCYSDDPVVDVESIEVKAGDVIEVIASTYNVDEPWAPPAGEVTINAAFEAKKLVTIITQPESETVAYGEMIGVNVVAEGEGLTYQWFCKDKGSDSFFQSSIKTAVYATKMYKEYDGRQLYCVVTDKNGNSVTSNTVTLTLKTAVKITTQPESETVAYGEMISVNVVAEGEGLTYQWFCKDKGSSSFFQSSIKTAVYATKMYKEYDGRQMYCVVTDKYGNSVTSNTVTLTLKTAVKITTQPVSVTVAAGDKINIKVVAEGEGLTYQWYRKDMGETSFSKSSITTAAYYTTMYQSYNGRQMYCVVTDKNGNSVTSNTVTITLASAVKITTQPVSVTVAAGDKINIKVVAEGEGLTYQWYYKAPGSSSYTKSSIATASYYTTMYESYNGRQMYCVVTDKNGNSVTSNTITITLASAVKITTQPVSVTVAAGDKINIKVVAQGDGLTYQWYYKAPGSSSYTKSSIATASYYTTMYESYSGRQMYCVVTDKYGNSVTSNVITITMGTTLKITTQPSSASVAVGSKIDIKVVAQGDGLTYQWYYKASGSSSYTKSSIATASYYTTMYESYSGRQMYCVVTDKYGNSVTSNVITITAK